MTSRKRDESKITRGKFLGIFAKIGLISLIPGLKAYAADKPLIRKDLKDDKSGPQLFHYEKKTVQSPHIKGKTLSQDVLHGRLSTENLENIRDVLTGRFFGKRAKAAFKNRSIPVLNWNLGKDGIDRGCGLYADINVETEIENCISYILPGDDPDEQVLKISRINQDFAIGGPITGDIGDSMACTHYCGEWCSNQCDGSHCSNYCSPQTILGFQDFADYSTDKFVSEITRILKTTDVGAIYDELKAVIFSDEVLNLGLQQIVVAGHESLVARFEQPTETSTFFQSVE